MCVMVWDVTLTCTPSPRSCSVAEAHCHGDACGTASSGGSSEGVRIEGVGGACGGGEGGEDVEGVRVTRRRERACWSGGAVYLPFFFFILGPSW